MNTSSRHGFTASHIEGWQAYSDVQVDGDLESIANADIISYSTEPSNHYRIGNKLICAKTFDDAVRQYRDWIF